MANYPGMAPHHYMPCGTWQANPWDANPPAGCETNMVWPQNPTPYQLQQGNGTGWSYNNSSLYPQHLTPGYQTQQQIQQQYCPPYGQPPPALTYQPNYGGQMTPQHKNDVSDSSQCRPRKSGPKFGGDATVPCPCCGNMTSNNNVRNYQTKIGKRAPNYSNSDSSSQDTVKQFTSMDDNRYTIKPNPVRTLLHTQDLDLYTPSQAPYQLHRNNNGILPSTQQNSYNNTNPYYINEQEQTNLSQSTRASQKRTASEPKRQLVQLPQNYNIQQPSYNLQPTNCNPNYQSQSHGIYRTG